MPEIHELKTHSEFFVPIFSGMKNFEVRKNDRNFKIGDELILKEYCKTNHIFSGRILHRRIDYILHGGKFGIDPDYVVLSISKI